MNKGGAKREERKREKGKLKRGKLKRKGKADKIGKRGQEWGRKE